MKNALQHSANSANQPGDTPENEYLSTRTRAAARRIDAATIEAVAALVSRGLTESEACRQLNIRPKTFFNFKSSRRNDERFAEILEKFRASRVEDLIAKIEKSASGDGMKMRDWRAAKFLLEVLDRQRFNTAAPLVEVNVTPGAPPPHILALMLEQLDVIYAEPRPVRAMVVDASAKQLAAPPESEKSA